MSKSERSAASRLRELSEGSGHEYGVFIKGNNVGEPFTSGLADKVMFDASGIEPGTSLFHRHTNEMPLSTQDFSLLLNENVEKIGNITRNNDVFVASVGSGWRPSKEEFKQTVERIDDEIGIDMQNNFEFLSWTIEERNYMCIREKAYRIARAFEWRIEGGHIDD